MTADLLARARAWLAEDPDPDTRQELAGLLSAAEARDVVALDDLRDRFSRGLEFGTAGLRGELGAGPNRMNRVVVIRAAAGFAAYLRERGGDMVVIGYDARRKSDRFALDTASVLTGAGIRALLLPRPLPTPVLAFAVRHLRCAGGVMVTASHNPPQDNGYKVYLGDGSQIVPPADTEIAAAIAAVGPLAEVPLHDGGEVLCDDLVEAYVARAARVAKPGGPRDVRVVYTPLHGVGRDLVVPAFARAGFPAPDVVPEQAEPDPHFPTVPFPNPEEAGALDLALARADQVDADLVVANDPDADRLAVAVDGRRLTGDELGALLATWLLSRGVLGSFATTIVSSSLLGRVAAAAGTPYAETLTGFKWLTKVPHLAFAYEEALGYCVDPEGVRDKDGISAAVLVTEMAAALRPEGLTLLDALDDLARLFGVHATDQLSVRVTEMRAITDAMTKLRASPPAELGGLRVEAVDDFAAGHAGLPPTDAVRYRLERGARVVVRPSGTEPKLKCYLEVVEPVTDDVGSARARAAERLTAVRRDIAAAAGVVA